MSLLTIIKYQGGEYTQYPRVGTEDKTSLH